MNKRYSMISVMICGLIFPSFSTANTLYFKGTIVEQTCKVNHYGLQPTITCLYGGLLTKENYHQEENTHSYRKISIYQM